MSIQATLAGSSSTLHVLAPCCRRSARILLGRARSFATTNALSKEKLAILGSGWGGYRILQGIDKKRYDVTLISPVGHFNFTPLLAGASVGTLEFRCAVEGVRKYARQVTYHEAWADSIDFQKRSILCTTATPSPFGQDEGGRQKFHVKFDKLVIGVGAYANTFNTPGVKEHATFLKDVGDARRIRMRIIERFEQAASPNLSDTERRALLHFAIVGGGPTGIEFAAELHDLLSTDMPRYYPRIHKLASISVYEVSQHILGGFDEKLQEYASRRFQREGITLKKGHHVERVEETKLVTKEEGEVPAGLVVWSTGLALNPLIESLENVSKTKKALLTDGTLHVLDAQGKPMPDVWAIGDCAMVNDGPTLPATAQVASQKADFVTDVLNKLAKGRTPPDQEFKWKNKGSLAYLGDWKALYDRTAGGGGSASGTAAFILWRSAYYSLQLSWRNRITVPMYWFINFCFGRDITRF
ncbi:FAD/NAD(P)-binding domain-containing protein [Cystobasidium minutum MCA 4210]|uniref:FAD/NAD(P)-binding domain-containing protein n=1 Tax=Cystobasidium minutum MCA 4210 TaxID=1397322 RepID=UPI0034CF1B66|eukprot:jgi/Rhomi1/182580/fgenesh1_pm.1_\